MDHLPRLARVVADERLAHVGVDHHRIGVNRRDGQGERAAPGAEAVHFPRLGRGGWRGHGEGGHQDDKRTAHRALLHLGSRRV